MAAIHKAVRRIQFCCGHRLLRHESKCRHLHGHNYVAFFTVCAELDSVGRVIDFSVLKERLGAWIDQHWDHGLLLCEADEVAIGAARALGEQKLFLMPDNPTAENMAAMLLYVAAPDALKGTGARVSKVVLWETENCYAEVSDDAWS